jgi:hypothetical protein
MQELLTASFAMNRRAGDGSVCYNEKPPHSSLANIPPAEFAPPVLNRNLWFQRVTLTVSLRVPSNRNWENLKKNIRPIGGS